MKRILIIGEGQTEQEFCKDILQPYFISKNISIHCPLIKKTGGGIAGWTSLKKQIVISLQQDPDVFVTTLIDYYGIKAKHHFPAWKEAHNIMDRNERMDKLEQEMKADVSDKLNNRFLPYIQLHEFEGLLFNNVDAFTRLFENEITDLSELKDTIKKFPNPELLNDGSTTAPSKRLTRLISGYNKVVYGAFLAEEIGLAQIRNKCPRFNSWLDKLEYTTK